MFLDPVPPAILRRRQRGISLLEALAALFVLGASTIVAADLQGRLRAEGDFARQRSEALLVVSREIEELRAFTQMAAAPGVRSYAGITDEDRVVDSRSGLAANTSYRVERRVEPLAMVGANALSIAIGWLDRRGLPQRIVVDTLVAASDPMYSGALAVGGSSGGVHAPRGAFGRAPAIPASARDLGDGRSAWKPEAQGTIAWVFDNRSGAIVDRCAGIAAATATRSLALSDLSACDGAARLLLSGTIRFTGTSPPIAALAGDAPLPVAVAVTLAGGSYPAPAECVVDAMKTVRYVRGGSVHIEAMPAAAVPSQVGAVAWTETDRFASYHCALAPRAGGRWSGRTTLVAVGWTIGAAAGDRRVCRFAADADGSGAVDANAEHPSDYVDVGAALRSQNFLVVPGHQACPASSPPRLGGQGPVVQADLGTLPHQP